MKEILSITLIILGLTLTTYSQEYYPEDHPQEQMVYREDKENKDKPCKNKKCDDENLPLDSKTIWLVGLASILGAFWIIKRNK